jgi:AcrR family transcriptional regulator
MGVRERKARQRESLRQDILDAARQILLDEGPNHLSMRQIARRIEYTPTTIYLHFKDKADLLFHLCEEVYGKVADVLEAAGAGEQDPIAGVRAMMRAYIEFGLAEPDRYRIAFMTDTTPSVDPSSFLKAGSMEAAAYDLVRQRVKDAIEKDEDNTDEVDAVAQTLWAMAHGIVSLLITHRTFPWAARETLIETSLRLITETLYSRSTGRRP